MLPLPGFLPALPPPTYLCVSFPCCLPAPCVLRLLPAACLHFCPTCCYSAVPLLLLPTYTAYWCLRLPAYLILVLPFSLLVHPPIATLHYLPDCLPLPFGSCHLTLPRYYYLYCAIAAFTQILLPFHMFNCFGFWDALRFRLPLPWNTHYHHVMPALPCSQQR